MVAGILGYPLILLVVSWQVFGALCLCDLRCSAISWPVGSGTLKVRMIVRVNPVGIRDSQERSVGTVA